MVVSQRGVGFIYMGCCLFVCFCILVYFFLFLVKEKKKRKKKKETNLNGIKVLFQFQHCLV